MYAELRKSTIEELKTIIKKDYGVSISDIQAKELGYSLLRLSKLAVVALLRADKNKSHENS